MSFFFSKPSTLPTASEALPDRSTPMTVPMAHTVLGHPLTPPFPKGIAVFSVGLGCFWGAERLMWLIPGVWTTAVGYQGGITANPTYEDVCSGKTGHAEVVLVAYDPTQVSFETLLKTFWEEHDPTQGMRQGNDHGTQYRSVIFCTTEEQLASAIAARKTYSGNLQHAGKGSITTELNLSPPFYYAESYHQQYLDKNPQGYCGLQGTGVQCSIGTGILHSPEGTETPLP